MSSFKVIINRYESVDLSYDKHFSSKYCKVTKYLMCHLVEANQKIQCNADGCEECLKIGSSRYVF